MSNVVSVPALVRTQVRSDPGGVKYRYALGALVDVNTFVSTKALDEHGRLKHWAREQVYSIWVAPKEGAGKRKVWQRPFKDGALHSLFVHPSLGAVLVSHKGDMIEDLWTIHEMAAGKNTSTADRALLKIWLEREHRFCRCFNEDEARAWDILIHKSAKARADAEEAAKAEAKAKREAEIEAEKAELRRLDEESRTRANARREKIQSIISREKIVGITDKGQRLVAIPVEEGEYEMLDDGTRCVFVRGESLEFFQVSKSRGGRVGRKNLLSATPIPTVGAPHAASQEVKPSSLVGTTKVVRGEVEQEVPIFSDKDDVKEFLRGHADQIAALMEGSGKVQVFAFQRGVLSSLGHHPIA